MKLFMIILGCKPPARNTEQHDIFFGIANNLKNLVPEMLSSWPEAINKIHIDAWREVNTVDSYKVEVYKRQENFSVSKQKIKLFFINLGGYKPYEFEEFHYKMLVACENKLAAIQRAKESAFYKHTGFKGANSHIDDKYGVDVDDIFEIEDILPVQLKEEYGIILSPAKNKNEDELNIGYLKIEKLQDLS